MDFDAYSNYVEIWLKSANGTPLSLQNLARGNPEGLNLRGPQYVQFVESVKINVSLFRFIQISVSLRPSYEEALNLIRSGVLGMGFSFSNKSNSTQNPEFASAALKNFGYNQIIVRLHSGSKSSQYFKAMLLVPEFNISQDSIDIELKAVGFMNFTRQRGTSKTYTGQTYRQIIEELAEDKSNNFTIYVNPNDAQANNFLNKIPEGGAKNINHKNWEAIKDILRQGNLVVIDTGSTDISGAVVMQIVSKDFTKKKSAPYEFVAFRNIDPEKGIYPIVNMRTSIVNYAANQTLSSIVNSVSDATKQKPKDDAQSKVGPETSKEFSSGVMSQNGTMPGKDPVDPNAKGKTKSSPMNGEGYQSKLKGYWQSLVDSANSYTINTVGIPDALPGRPVKVTIGDNVPFLSSTYDCFEIEHSWTNNGSETQFSLHNTLGIASVIDSGISKIEKKVNAADSNKVNKQAKKA